MMIHIIFSIEAATEYIKLIHCREHGSLHSITISRYLKEFSLVGWTGRSFVTIKYFCVDFQIFLLLIVTKVVDQVGGASLSSSTSNSLSFISSVMRSTSQSTGKIISKKLWRPRSKSQSRAGPQITSPWTPPTETKVSRSCESVSEASKGHLNICKLQSLSLIDVFLFKN